jgi:hypothetical protein
MLNLRHLLGLALIAGGQTALAQIGAGGATFKCVDDAGRSTYTNVKEEMGGKKCTVVSREVSVVPVPNSSSSPGKAAPAAPRQAGTAPASGAGGPPRVDASTQRARDNDRRRILDEELQTAEKQLSVAKQTLIQQEAIRTGDERNYQRVLDRLKPFQDDVRRAEENVASLKREISNLR